MNKLTNNIQIDKQKPKYYHYISFAYLTWYVYSIIPCYFISKIYMHWITIVL